MNPSSNSRYIPHIDGIRGLAVLIILIYHTKLVPISGGFLGVDVFFVISGFLITKLIVSDLDAGRFSFKRFYLRRVRRLAPALLLIVAITSIFIWRFLSPTELVEYAKSALAAFSFVSNIWFYLAADYHATEAARLPLLHTWSLAVEEQFYIFYSLILVWILRQYSVSTAKFAVLILAILSLIFAHLNVSYNPQSAFYLISSRAWELLLGALGFLFFSSLRLGQGIRETLVMIALIGLLASIVVFDARTPHPGLISLLPLSCAFVLVVFGGGTTLAKWGFENSCMIWFGKISYSLYLVHFPLISFFYLQYPDQVLKGFQSVKITVLAIMLAALSYYLVENPLRHSSTKKFSVFGFSSGAVIFIACAYFMFSDGMKFREKAVAQLFLGTEKESLHLLKDGQRCYVNRSGKGCRFDEYGSSRKIINIGDSHGYALARAMGGVAADMELDYEAINMTHCPYIPNAWRTTGFKATCTVEMQEQARQYLLSLDPSIVVISVRYPMYFNSEPFDNGEGGKDTTLYLPFYPAVDQAVPQPSVGQLYAEALLELAEHGHQVVLIYPVPEVGWHVPNLIRDRLVMHSPSRKLEVFRSLSITTSHPVYKQRIAISREILDQAMHPNILKIYPDQLFCNEVTARCRTHDEFGIFYRDNNHLSQYGAELLAEYIRERL